MKQFVIHSHLDGHLVFGGKRFNTVRAAQHKINACSWFNRLDLEIVLDKFTGPAEDEKAAA